MLKLKEHKIFLQLFLTCKGTEFFVLVSYDMNPGTRFLIRPASAQAGQSLLYPPEDALDPWLPKGCPTQFIG